MIIPTTNAFPTTVKETVKKKLTKRFENVYVPFCFGGDPYIDIDFEGAYFNSKYEPFAVMLYTLRKSPEFFYDMCYEFPIVGLEDSKMIEMSHQAIQETFNNLFQRLLRNKGNGYKGQASEEEMMMLGTLFYIILKTSDLRHGLVIDSNRMASFAWNQERYYPDIAYSQVMKKSKLLKSVCFSGFNWKHFLERYFEQMTSEDIVMIGCPEMNEKTDTGIEKEFCAQELYEIVTTYLPRLKTKDVPCLLWFESDEIFMDNFMKHFKVKKIRQNLYKTGSLFVETNVYQTSRFFRKGYTLLYNTERLL